MGYRYAAGKQLERALDEVVRRDVLRAQLRKRYSDLPDRTLDEAVSRFARPEGADTLRRNKAFHESLTRGIEVAVETTKGKVDHRHVHVIDWEQPEANDFLVVNQLPVRGRNDRLPDLLVMGCPWPSSS